MKKILIYILLSFSVISFFSLIGESVYATNSITVEVTEKVPGAGCTGPSGGPYKCNLWTGFWSVMSMLWRMIKYFTYIAGLAGVLFIVINGILYSMSGMDAGMKDEAKKRITKTLLGLVVLLLSGLILNMIAPWVYRI